MYVCVRACVRFSTSKTPITHKRLEISISNLVHQWSYQNPLTVTIIMTINARFVILWDFEFFEKFELLNFFYANIKFQKLNLSTKLLLWGSQNQARYSLKERIWLSRWGSNMGISIHMLFYFSTKSSNIKIPWYLVGFPEVPFWIPKPCTSIHSFPGELPGFRLI